MSELAATTVDGLEQARLLTPEQVADYLGIPIRTLYAWRYEGKGPKAIKLGRHLRYRRADLERHIEEQTDR